MLRAITSGLVALLVLSASPASAYERCFLLTQNGEEVAWFTLSSQWDHPTDDFSGTWLNTDAETGSIEGTYVIEDEGYVTIDYWFASEVGDHSGSVTIARPDLVPIECDY
ncbi:MAG: hypothetical protein CME06_15195 [Gemmatimonadetes bacterium]|nr:hypothetical protein [Gemmatimonadota bacterium]